MAETAARPCRRALLAGGAFSVVEARYYEAIGAMLLEGAEAAIAAAGATMETIGVPGAGRFPPRSPLRSTRPKVWGFPTMGPSRWAASSGARTFHFESSPENPRAR